MKDVPTTKAILVVSGVYSIKNLSRAIQYCSRNYSDICVVSDLPIPIECRRSNIKFKLIDEYRDKTVTLRKAAEQSEELLLKIRAFTNGLFEFWAYSLWVAEETNLLHFYFLRLIDYINVMVEVFKVEIPAAVICVGKKDLLSKVTQTITRSKRLRLYIIDDFPLSGIVQRITLKTEVLASRSIGIMLALLYVQCLDFLKRITRLINTHISKEQLPQSSGSKIVFLGTDKKQIDVILVLYDLISKNRLSCSIINLSKPKLLEWLREKGYRAESLFNFGNRAGQKEQNRARAIFARQTIRLFSNTDFREAFRHYNIDLLSMSCTHLLRLILKSLPYLVESAVCAYWYFKDYHAELVVTPGEWNAQSRACIIAAKHAGLKTVSLQRGDITNYPGWGGPIFSDVMCVNGPSVKQALVSRGVSKGKLVVTGDPRLDAWGRDKDFIFQTGESYHVLSIPPEKKIVAIMTNPVNLNEKASHAVDYITALLECGKDYPDLHFVIKMHPSEKDFYFYERIKKATQADNVTIIKDFNTPQLLHDATTVVTTISTTGDEAIFLGKPLIVVNLTNEPDFMPYAGSRAAITVREKSKVFEAVRSVIYDRAIREELQAGRREYIAEHLLSDDGMSAIRCVQVLLSMINKQQQEANGKKQS